MKTLMIFLSLFTISIDKPISFSDLIFVYENNLADASEKLYSNGFGFEQTQTTDNGIEGVVWVYRSEEIKDLFIAKFCLKSGCGSVQVQTSDFKTYTELKYEAKDLGFELQNSTIDGYSKTDGITHTFEKDKYRVEFTEAKYKNGSGSLYSMNIYKSE